jgi:hypothetical protein
MNWSFNSISIQWSLLKRSAMSMWSGGLVFQGLYLSPSLRVDVTSSVFTCYIYTQISPLSHPSLHGKWWVVSWSVIPCPSVHCMGSSYLVVWIYVPCHGSFSTMFLNSLVCFTVFTAKYYKHLRGESLSLDLNGLINYVVDVTCHSCQYHGVHKFIRFSALMLCCWQWWSTALRYSTG